MTPRTASTHPAALPQMLSALVASQPKLSGSDKRRNWRAQAANGSRLLIISEAEPNGKAMVEAQQSRLTSQEQNRGVKERRSEVLQRLLDHVWTRNAATEYEARHGCAAA